MAKRVQIDDKFFRLRRGVLVEIPEKWVGVCADPQAIRKRQSKLTRKNKNKGHGKAWKNPSRDLGHGDDKYLRYKRGEDVFHDLEEVEK